MEGDSWIIKWLEQNDVSAKLEIRYTWSSLKITREWLTDHNGKGKKQFYGEGGASVLF